MKQLLLFLSVMVCLSSTLYAQKDTVAVPGFYESGAIAPDNYGTLNNAIETAIANGTINNTVFKLTPYEAYVLSRSIFIDHGQSLEIVAPKPLRAGDGTPEEVQNSAPPQIMWTEEAIDRAYIIQSYGDVTVKNVWFRYADFLGSKVSSSITFENQNADADPEIGNFDGCLFDYDGIGSEAAGAICVKADHFVGNFQNSYWRNNSDNHFRYYGRAISFPYQSSGWHYDSLLFENCTFTNLGRIVMQEGNEYGDNVHINHCTMLNSLEWVFQSAGWIRNASITNSIFLNPSVLGYRALDVCDDNQDYDDFEDGLCDPPGGGLINGITAVDSFGFTVPFTDFDRKIFIGNNAYAFSQYLLDWYKGCGWCKTQIQQRHPEELYNPSPMLGEDEIAFIDSVDGDNNKVFKTMNVDWNTIFDADPDFIVEATNEDTFLIFVEYKWSTAADVDWSYEPYAAFKQVWPLPENMAYNNAAYQTAAMGNLPLGDLNWWPAQLPAWEAQRDAEWTTINNWLNYGDPNGPSGVREILGVIPDEYALQQNYPNPFNPVTNIQYSIPVSGNVSLIIYNSLGQLVATIFNGDQQAGSYIAEFDASGLASGIYMYQLQSGNVTLTKKFVLMK
ncbi:MAG TPA: T9SS type A sorting domain-containing protein [Chitinophagaceae bacterium]|nr:T9SS type A sorting domain-containing protein [Chitinophagaceae bacterium]